jgi:CRP/FNR family cyclic AMP-dependent transcriptional regulator
MIGRNKMFKIASYETFKDGQIIFEEGSNGDWIYVVEEGEVEISKKIGGQKIIIETLKENDIFGEIAYIDKTPRSATATAKGTTVVGIIDRDFFDAEFNKISADFQRVLKMVAFRLRTTTQKSVTAQTGKGDRENKY